MMNPLKREREDQHIKQFRLASLVGISPSELSNYERGIRRPPADVRQRIAKALAVPADKIFPPGFDEETARLKDHGDIWTTKGASV